MEDLTAPRSCGWTVLRVHAELRLADSAEEFVSTATGLSLPTTTQAELSIIALSDRKKRRGNDLLPIIMVVCGFV
uniref:Uncharacterized protein n=1 Tax=Knipowitschia caucasica TaxID=637954 RepID=A0AAV2KAW0_KNICA